MLRPPICPNSLSQRLVPFRSAASHRNSDGPLESLLTRTIGTWPGWARLGEIPNTSLITLQPIRPQLAWLRTEATRPASMAGPLHCDYRVPRRLVKGRSGPPLRSVSSLSLRLALDQPCPSRFSPRPDDLSLQCWGSRKFLGTHGNSGAAAADLSQLCPNNWVPLRPAESRRVSRSPLEGLLTGTDWYSVGLGGTGERSPIPP